jgi:uncharacterized protein YaaQ
MARPKKTGRRKQISTLLDWYYYDFLKKQADKQNISVSEMAKKVIEFQVDRKGGGTEIVGLEDEQLKRLNEIAKEKGMSANELMTRALSNYIDTYF